MKKQQETKNVGLHASPEPKETKPEPLKPSRESVCIILAALIASNRVNSIEGAIIESESLAMRVWQR